MVILNTNIGNKQQQANTTQSANSRGVDDNNKNPAVTQGDHHHKRFTSRCNSVLRHLKDDWLTDRAAMQQPHSSLTAGMHIASGRPAGTAVRLASAPNTLTGLWFSTSRSN